MITSLILLSLNLITRPTFTSLPPSPLIFITDATTSTTATDEAAPTQ